MSLVIRNRQPAPAELPLVMGILNVTPDSFSDGGVNFLPEAAITAADAMVAAGVDVIDVGPESTRPFSTPVNAATQIARAGGVIRAIRNRHPDIAISIDTRLAEVAEAALAEGADMVNDVSALRDDPRMIETIARAGVPVVLMHRRGTAADMQAAGGPHYDDVIAEVRDFLIERVGFALAQGVRRDRLILDPGIGFGKRTEHNFTILGQLHTFVQLGYPLLVGPSRKRFLGDAIEEPRARDAASIACAILAAEQGVGLIRVHNVLATVQALQVWKRVQSDQPSVD